MKEISAFYWLLSTIMSIVCCNIGYSNSVTDVACQFATCGLAIAIYSDTLRVLRNSASFVHPRIKVLYTIFLGGGGGGILHMECVENYLP